MGQAYSTPLKGAVVMIPGCREKVGEAVHRGAEGGKGFVALVGWVPSTPRIDQFALT